MSNPDMCPLDPPGIYNVGMCLSFLPWENAMWSHPENLVGISLTGHTGKPVPKEGRKAQSP